jgi:perosamine synthetase
MKVPLAKPEIVEADIAAVVEVLRSSKLSQGPMLQAFEEALAGYLGVSDAVAVNSGTSALQLALRALGIKDGDEVIVPSFSFMAVTNAVLEARAIPVFVDIHPGTYNIDPAKLAAALSAKTKAIIAIHTFGYPARMREIVEFARGHSLCVIEDACEAMGAESEGRKAGTLSDVGIFAFYPNKQITTGEGGALVTNRAEIAEALRRLRNQGRQPSPEWFQHVEVGYSYRLSDINCALGLQQLSRIEQSLVRREALAKSYEQKLSRIESVALHGRYSKDERISWFTCPVLLPATFRELDRDQIWAALKQAGIECGRYFPPAHLQPVMRKAAHRCGDLSETVSVAARTLCLPFFHSLEESEMEYVCGCLGKALAQQLSSRSLSHATS